ncbi:MAG: AMP-binding protein [Actinomycetota bacterium]|nr:AMP-binding protein [Actinomycetota bacterium]
MTLTISHATGPSSPPIHDTTIGQILRDAAAAAPDRLAIIEGLPDAASRRQWTFAELDVEADRVARALLAHFAPGDQIAVWAQNIPEWEMLEFGVARAGMVIVTVNPGYQAAELRYVLNQSKAKALFCVDSFRGNPMLATAQAVQPECPELREIVRFAEWEAFLDSGDPSTELPPVAPTDAVMIQYTSGTTGFPKGALLHHRGLVNNATHFMDRMGVADGNVYVTMMPLFHTAGSVMAVLGAVAHRCTQVLVPAFEPALALALTGEYRANALMGVPTMLIAMMEHDDFAGTDLSALTGVCSGGSLVPEQLVRTFERELGAPFTIVFGQTECSPVATMTRPDDTMEDKSGTIGAPMPHVEVKIVDTETGDTVPIGVVGELCTRGYHVMHNYFEMPEQTAEAIDADGWLHTGDLAAMNDRGYCSIEGRLKDMIIRGGENIYPRELEELLFAHPSIGSVAVIGLPDDRWGETVAAFVRPAPGASISKDELFAYMRDHLAPHKTPRHWFEIDEFPLTGSGKIQKFKLREQWQQGSLTEL